MRHHHHRHSRHCRFSHLWYWATGAAIAEAAFWAAIPGAIALWWLLWAAAYGAMIATRRMWHLTQPADGTEPHWQQALDAARPSWPKRRPARRAY
jgi:hypothetical protein